MSLMVQADAQDTSDTAVQDENVVMFELLETIKPVEEPILASLSSMARLIPRATALHRLSLEVSASNVSPLAEWRGSKNPKFSFGSTPRADDPGH